MHSIPGRIPKLFYRVRNRWRLWVFRCIILLTVGCILFWVLDARMKPVLRDYAEARAVYLATKAVNDAVSEEIIRSGVEYLDLITLEKDSSGRVTALHTDVVGVNALKARIITVVIEKLNRLDTSQIGIPLGNLTGVNMLGGVGPVVSIRVVPLGSASADFGSVFSTAGINQTRHQIMMTVHADITILLPRDSISTSVETEVQVAETVIVGSVPEAYTNVEDGSGDSVSEKIFNYS